MRTKHRSGWLLLACLSVAACDRAPSLEMSKPAAAPPRPMQVALPQANLLEYAPARRRADSQLAYEHNVVVELSEQAIPARIDALHQACLAQPDAGCELLNVTQSGGDHPSGTVTMRVVPKGVDALVRQAAADGEIAERSLDAEDLAEFVADNTLRRTRLEREHARLLEFQDRPNVKLGDMLRLSDRLADVEAQLNLANEQSAQLQRRIHKDLLTVRFQPQGVEVGGSAIGDAFRDSLEIAGRSTAWLVRAAAASIPIGVVVAMGAWGLWRLLRRRRVRATA
ncbi:DUF4349 domain-containing protein [Lysobacter sp. A6]|uniref:DUF4349 domain-containing protein n=1 Tax=Noviluteimonas lactosilytica TaxID=2888523 RepID=A0ABS8JF71_9GAMM|nr:DUF4349 domain-containing protein [Lysobacter lactosilyticus]MCC8362253.1 DUF4349 domain-containing protein [Lysobacter lactosilyticus]